MQGFRGADCVVVQVVQGFRGAGCVGVQGYRFGVEAV